jgi:hypothetical protein
MYGQLFQRVGMGVAAASLGVLMVGTSTPARCFSGCCDAPADRSWSDEEQCGTEYYIFQVHECGYDEGSPTYMGSDYVYGCCTGGYYDCACQWKTPDHIHGEVDYHYQNWGTMWEVWWEAKDRNAWFIDCGPSDPCYGNAQEQTGYLPSRWEGWGVLANDCQ